MNAFEPIINLLVFLTALSIAAERLTNLIKLHSVQLRGDKQGAAAKQADLTEKQREQRITTWGVIVGILLALFLKADLIAALNRLDAPWETLGWLQMHGSMWTWSPAAATAGGIVHAVIGSIATGAALGFGSKFWHEILDAVLELRNMAKLRNEGARSRTPVRPRAKPEGE